MSDGPACHHAAWRPGCEPCADWAAKDGVAFARQMVKRLADAEEQLAAAHDPAPYQEAARKYHEQGGNLGAFDLTDEAVGRAHVVLGNEYPAVNLSGEGAAAYEEFRASAAALHEHQTATAAAVMERYRKAIARLSAAAIGAAKAP